MNWNNTLTDYVHSSFYALTFVVALDRLLTSLCHQECRWNISDRRCICRTEDQFPLDCYYIGIMRAFYHMNNDERRPINSVYPISASVYICIYIYSIFRNYTCMQWYRQLFQFRFQFGFKESWEDRSCFFFFQLAFFPSIKFFAAVESERSKGAGNTRRKRQTRIYVRVRSPWAKITYKEENSANVRRVSIRHFFFKFLIAYTERLCKTYPEINKISHNIILSFSS